jgi:cobalt-zinc-cadmium efflux system membrane fusion protein
MPRLSRTAVLLALGLLAFAGRGEHQKPPGVELVPGQAHTLAIPEDVRRSLGILKRDGKEAVFEARVPSQTRPLVLTGSTALEPTRIQRIRARFAPAECLSVNVRPGDRVKPNQELATFHSADLRRKKTDLYEAVVQLRLDETARRNVEADRDAVRRARDTLLKLGVAVKDVEAVEEKARALEITEGRRKDPPRDQREAMLEEWARVVIKAPDFKPADSPIVVEVNVVKGEMVEDKTVNLFTLARVDTLLVLANCPEDNLPELFALDAEARKNSTSVKWTVQMVGRPERLEGAITEVGVVIDPNQHTALLKGSIPNPDGKVRAGQFVAVTIQLPAPPDVVEVPSAALVEDGKQSLVFVQTDARKHHYQMRRVEVVSRLDKTVFVKARIAENARQTAEEKEQGLLPREGLQPASKGTPGARVLVSGAVELKAALRDLESQQGQRDKR